MGIPTRMSIVIQLNHLDRRASDAAAAAAVGEVSPHARRHRRHRSRSLQQIRDVLWRKPIHFTNLFQLGIRVGEDLISKTKWRGKACNIAFVLP